MKLVKSHSVDTQEKWNFSCLQRNPTPCKTSKYATGSVHINKILMTQSMFDRLATTTYITFIKQSSQLW